MLTENDIVENLSKFLEESGYIIKQKLTTNQTGIDIIAENKSEKLYVEAKGETSSIKTSNRFGKAFNRNQVKSHISVALLASMRVIASNQNDYKTKIGIALPNNEEHKKIISEIALALKKLEIRIYWVSPNDVKIE